MSVGFGFSVGDILACGKFCHQVYKACFSEAHDASASWTALGKELVLLGDALQNLCSDEGIIPQDPFKSPETHEKEQRALDAVRMVVGDFQETLKDLKTFLLRYGDFQKPDAGKQYWLKIKFTVNSGEVDKFRARVAMHTRAVHLLLNPLIYQSQKAVETTVTHIQTRIDTIDQVLQALLVVASEQLTTASSSRNPRRIADRAHTRLQNGHPPYLITEAPRNPQTIPEILAPNKSKPRGGEDMLRTNSYPVGGGGGYEDTIKMGISRPFTEVGMMSSHSPKSPYPPNGRRVLPASRDGEEKRGSEFSSISTGTTPSEYRTPRQRSSLGTTEFSDNPISRALRQSAMSETAKKRPIEHWITAAMHWYFKAEKDLEDPDNPEVTLEAYLGLMKSSWIVENVINRWEADDSLPEEIKRNIKTLVALIVAQFRKIKNREMPDIRGIDPESYEIWHKDIVLILVEPASPLSSRASSRESTFSYGAYCDDQTPPRRTSETSSDYTHATNSPDFDPPPDQTLWSPRPPADYPVAPVGYHNPHIHEEWGDFPNTNTAPLTGDSGGNEASPLHEYFPGSGVSRCSPNFPSSSGASNVPTSENGQNLVNPRDYDPIDSIRTSGRSASISTTSTGSSGRRESFYSTQHPTGSTPTFPVPAPAKPAIKRRPVPESPISYSPAMPQPPEDDHESYEGLGERTILDTTRIMWASQVSGPFQRGTVKVFWHQSTGFFRIYTRYSLSRACSHEVPLRGTELIPEYAYEDEPIIYLRKTTRLPGPNNGPSTTSPTAGGDSSRIGHVYKFTSSESMFDLQRALTSEGVYQDLVRRVASVKLKRASEKGSHTYHHARLQLWHENPPADALVTDIASGMTGVSQASRAKFVLRCSRLMIYFGGSGCFLTCFLTDDITLKSDGNKLMLVPTKYKGGLVKSPKTVKACTRGSEISKGGFRLDKEKISPGEEYSFEDFSYIHINFKDTEHLNKFQKLWNEMMATRRLERARIRAQRQQLEATTWAPLAVS